ncbi:hypothetical protein [Tenacibaculum amylolyticum]|uniref:hypothetical protein n=1 Tax=Tenacibaculum amylolyticum TaxID=104269 RepID=UPI0038945DA3
MDIYKILSALFIFNTVFSYSQKSTTDKLNLDFEIVENGKPKDWKVFPNKNEKFIEFDNSIVKNGNKAVSLEHKRNKKTSLLSYIPAIHKGKQLKVTAYIKTKGVKHVEFWTRADHNGAYANKYISGTNDWTKFEIMIDLTEPLKYDYFTFGVTLKGKGKVWIDDFELSIDNKNIHHSKKVATLFNQINRLENYSESLIATSSKNEK